MGRKTRYLFAVVALGLSAHCATGSEGSTDWGRTDDGGDVRDGVDVPSDEGDTGCPPGRSRCPSGCADLISDPANCGICGHTCGAAEVCNEGTCSGACGGGLLPCSSGCADPTNDPENCGSCGHACPDALNADGVCELSSCIIVCRAGYQDRDGTPGCEYACTPSSTAESCNGVDDDCDGSTDEDFACAVGRSTVCTASCGTTGAGPCTLGCTPPAGGACTPPVESCNGIDDDCDTTPDDGFACTPGAGGPCSTTCGSTGTRACSAGCTWGACTVPPETCNGRDDDCDGAADNGFACPAGSSGTCSTSCSSVGTRTCNASCNWDACSPPGETCNGHDDNCDTRVDEGYECTVGSTQACSTSCGSGTRTCTASCTWGACGGPAETCNGRDDDCDGATDEGFECVLGSTGSCSTSCGSGTRTCSGSCTWGGCNATETCNGADDDCDGVTDDGFRAVAQNTTYTAMSAILWPCDGSTQLIGPDCNATIHRFCGSATPPCATSGFGPVESSGDSLSVTCVIAPPALDATFPALQAIHGGCDGSVQRAGPDCNAAINRYCQARGYVSGFGPVENSYPAAWVVCVPSSTAVYVNATYTTLSGYQWMCDGSYERWGLYCNSAIHNYCRALGHASGFGPVENSGDNADVICVDS